PGDGSGQSDRGHDRKTMTRRIFVIVAVTLAVAGVVLAQTATVRITGPRSLNVSPANLAAMPHSTVTVPAGDQPATYEGVPMRELLTRAGVPSGESLRGRELSVAVVVTGADGYRVVFGIAEFDPGFTDRVAILADRKNGVPLTGNDAPFELILTG